MLCECGRISRSRDLLRKESSGAWTYGPRHQSTGFGSGIDPWQERDLVMPDVNSCTQKGRQEAYEMAGLGPEDIDLIELHDCFATAEILHYGNLGICKQEDAGRMIDEGEVALGGRIPVNVSGGLLSKGIALRATGIANIYEVSTHLRNEAGSRQVEGAKIGLTHVIGLGSACAIHVLERAQ